MEEEERATVSREPSAPKISLSGITASYPTVDEYIKQLRTSPLFKTVELISVSSILQEEQRSRLTQPRADLRGGTFSRPTERSVAEITGSVREEGEETIKKENVQFTLEIMIDPSQHNVGTGLGK